MANYWEQQFKHRMDGFRLDHPPGPNEVAFSIKVRAPFGCFHREHSPCAYELIDGHLASIPQDQRQFAFEEHESGPELLVIMQLTAGGLFVLGGVINLITAIINARAAGIKKGDRPAEPIELIVRREIGNGAVKEEKVLRFTPSEKADATEIENALTEATKRLIDDES